MQPSKKCAEPLNGSAPSYADGPPGAKPGEYDPHSTADVLAWELARPNFWCPVTQRLFSKARFCRVWNMDTNQFEAVHRTAVQQHRPYDGPDRNGEAVWDPEDDPEYLRAYRVHRLNHIARGLRYSVETHERGRELLTGTPGFRTGPAKGPAKLA